MGCPDQEFDFKNIPHIHRREYEDDCFTPIKLKKGGKTIHTIANDTFTIIGGPCIIHENNETYEIDTTHNRLTNILASHTFNDYNTLKSHINVFRAGAFKMRSNPYNYSGDEYTGLILLSNIRDYMDKCLTISEITEINNYRVDSVFLPNIAQIGMKNMRNYQLLKQLSSSDRIDAIMLKRAQDATMQEWLYSAEYILKEENVPVILCERGIRTFEPYTRNTLDISCVPAIKSKLNIPIFVDISHATGRKETAYYLARAVIASGADGIMIETSDYPDSECDGKQTISTDFFKYIVDWLYENAKVFDKKVIL